MNQYNNILTSALATTENNIIISEIFKIVSTLRWNSSKKYQFLTNLFCCFPKIATILFIKYLTMNSDSIWNKFFSLIKFIIFSQKKFNSYDSKSLNSFIHNEIRKCSDLPNSLFLNIDSSMPSSVRTIRFLPYPKFYKDLLQRAEKNWKQSENGVASCSSLLYDEINKNITTQVVIPNQMFPSQNYKKLASTIDQCINASEKLEYWQVIPILINGEPGLGKSKSLDYLACNTRLSNIIKVDMTRFIDSDTEININSIITTVLSKIKGNGETLILFDEIDKYISGFIERSLLGSHSDKSDQRIIETVSHINSKILNSILSLIDSDMDMKRNLFIIFCSNNFETIFDHVNMTHYKSLETRFIKFRFSRMDKIEYFDYIKWMDSKLNSDRKEPFDKYYEEMLKTYYNVLPSTFSITYREMFHHVVRGLYDIPTICENIYKSDDNHSSESFLVSSYEKIIPKNENLSNLKNFEHSRDSEVEIKTSKDNCKKISSADFGKKTNNDTKNISDADYEKKDKDDRREKYVEVVAEAIKNNVGVYPPYKNSWGIVFASLYAQNNFEAMRHGENFLLFQWLINNVDYSKQINIDTSDRTYSSNKEFTNIIIEYTVCFLYDKNLDLEFLDHFKFENLLVTKELIEYFNFFVIGVFEEIYAGNPGATALTLYITLSKNICKLKNILNILIKNDNGLAYYIGICAKENPYIEHPLLSFYENSNKGSLVAWAEKIYSYYICSRVKARFSDPLEIKHNFEQFYNLVDFCVSSQYHKIYSLKQSLFLLDLDHVFPDDLTKSKYHQLIQESKFFNDEKLHDLFYV